MTVRLLQFVLFRHADKEDGCCFDCQPVVVLFAIVAFVILVLVVFVVMAFYQLPEVRKDSTVAQTPDCCSQLGDLVVVDCWYENSSTIYPIKTQGEFLHTLQVSLLSFEVSEVLTSGRNFVDLEACQLCQASLQQNAASAASFNEARV